MVFHMLHPIYTQRRKRLLEKLPANTMALLPSHEEIGRNYPANPYLHFRASSHFLYLVGKHYSHAYLLLIPGDKARLYMEENTMSDQLWHGIMPSFEVLSEQHDCQVLSIEQLASDLKRLGLDSIATIPSFYPHIRQKQSELLGRTVMPVQQATAIDVTLCEAMIALRLIHDEYAIQSLKLAAELTTQAHHLGMQKTQLGQSTASLYAVMLGELQKNGLTSAYPPIITTHGEVLHCHHYKDVLKDGDLLLVDFGAETENGWAGDVTRTWPVNGKFDPYQREIYTLVLEIQKRAIELVKPGMEYRKIHEFTGLSLAQALKDIGILQGDTAQSLFEQNAHALFFPHGIGHLIGLDVHDMEDLGDRAGYEQGRTRVKAFGAGYLRLDRKLEQGMAVTIEPGFYQVEALLKNTDVAGPNLRGLVNWERLEAFKSVRGIRIEDDILVGENGPINLTQRIVKEIDELEMMIGKAVKPV
jgi:Xaa-Pro aminopeptidase